MVAFPFLFGYKTAASGTVNAATAVQVRHELPSEEPAGATAGWDREKGVWTSAAVRRGLLGAVLPLRTCCLQGCGGRARWGRGSGEAPRRFLLWGLGFCSHRFGPGKVYFLLAILLFLVANMS